MLFGILVPVRAFIALLVLVLAAGLAWAWLREAPAAPAPPEPVRTDGIEALPERDHERVRAAVARGEMVPLSLILADALRRYPGTVLEVELEGHEYEVEILGADGVIMELEYDARTGALLEIEVDD